jgi:hypothetical protein
MSKGSAYVLYCLQYNGILNTDHQPTSQQILAHVSNERKDSLSVTE